MAPRFVRADVRQMERVTPDEQPTPGERVVKLNTNENPFPPSPKVMQVLREIEPEQLRRYPSATAESFCEAVARAHGITSDMVLAGNGCDEILAIATRTFVPCGGTLAFGEPTYPLYAQLAKREDAKPVGVPWSNEWSLPADELIALKPDAIFLANPNSPSGTFVSPSQVADLASRFNGLLLIDEALSDFAEDNCLPLVREFPNVVVARSFSKGYSLAGLRCGYCIAQAEVIAEMLKVKDMYNIDSIAMLAAGAALEDQEYARRSWEHVKSERQRMTSELQQLGWSVLPSQANFILATAPAGRGKDVYTKLKQQGILVHHFDRAGLQDKIRITIGTSQENNALLGGIRALGATEKAA
jgi:histidinol-phosphate aminotransferase